MNLPMKMAKTLDVPSNEEEASAFEELCDRNGIDMSKSTSNRFSIKKLEMFFDGFQKIVGLQYFPFLSELVIIGQNISKIENLNGLHHLKELWLADCRIAVIDSLDDLVNLERLYLHGNRIRHIENLQNLRMLKTLWLARNYISVVENLSSLHHLTELNLAENRIHTIGHGLDMNNRLETLNLSGNPISSFKELANLSRLSHLKSLSLRDPTYKSAPLAESVNYSTQMIFYMPNLEFLDANEIKSKLMQEIATSTVLKKKAFYDMRMNGVERTVDAVLNKLLQAYSSLVDQVKKNVALLALGKKEMMCYMQHEISASLLQPKRTVTELDFGKQNAENERTIACRPCEVSVTYAIETENSAAAGTDLDSLCHIKMAQIDSAMLRMQRTLTDLDLSKNEITMELDRMRQLWKTFLRVELETAGNVFFEFGTEKDPWFNHCRQLVASRFCAADYSNYSVSQVNVLGVVRISNRHQRTQFDLKLESAIVDKHEHLWQLTMLEIARRANIEYLFYMPSEDSSLKGYPLSARPSADDLIAELADFLGAIEQGFGGLQKNGVPLTNSLFWADRRRFPIPQNVGIGPPLHGRLRFGQALLCKVFCGNCQTAESGNNAVTPEIMANCDTIVRPCLPTSDQTSKSNTACPDCAKRIQEWVVFDNERVLPEYMVFYQYDSIRLPSNPFSNFVEAVLAQSQNPSVLQPNNTITNAFAVESDADIVASEPIFSLKTQLSGDDVVAKIKAHPNTERITRLCLYDCNLANLPPLKFFPNLTYLDVSLNRISSFPDHREMGAALSSLEQLNVSFNDFSTCDSMPQFGRLKTLDISWNLLTDLNLVLGQLRRQVPFLTDITGGNNPWFRSKNMRARFIAAFKNIKSVDGVSVSDDEKALAHKISTAASLSNIEAITQSLVVNGRTDNVLPHLVALGPSCQQILSTSHAKPKPSPETLLWVESITTLVLDGQGLTKLAGVERLKNLKWASFCDNFLTSIHGIEGCYTIVELLLDNNCLTSVEHIDNLVNLATLSVNNNRLTNIEWQSPEKLQVLAYLSVNGNLITSPNGAQNLPALQNLYMANNNIDNIREIFLLKNAESLFSLDLFGSAVCNTVNYRLSVIYHLPHLKILDTLPIELNESNTARDYFGGKLSEDFVLDRLGLGPGADLSQITELDLANCGLFTIEISPLSLPNVRSINLENNNLTNLGTLAYSASIHVLCLNNNHIETMMPPAKGRPPALGPKSKVDSGLSSQMYLTLGEGDMTPILPFLEVLYLAGNSIRNLNALQLNRIPSLVTLFLQNNEISVIEGIDCLSSLRDLVLDRNRIKALHEHSFIGQGRLLELHLEENRLRDLSYFSHLRNLRRLYLGGNKLQMASELERLQDLRKLHEISLVNNPLTRKNVHRSVMLYYLPQLHLIDGMPVSEDDTAKAQMLANQEDPQSAVMGGAAVPTNVATYLCGPVNPNPGILPVHVYQPVGLPPAQATSSLTQNVIVAPTNSLAFYQTANYHYSQQQLQQQQQMMQAQQQPHLLGSYMVSANSGTTQQLQSSTNPQVKISNLQLGIAKPSIDDSAQSNNLLALSSPSMLSQNQSTPASAAGLTLNQIIPPEWNVRRLRVSPASVPAVLQQMNAKQLFMPAEQLTASSSQQQQDAVAKIHGNKLSRH